MNTITNKKGNEGFMIGGWTCRVDQSEWKAFRHVRDVILPTSNRGPDASLMIHHVRVMSRGKKQMTLLSLEGAHEMKGTFYSPNTVIHADRGEAVAEAARLLAECEADIIAAAPAYFEKHYTAPPPYLNEQGRKVWAEEKEKARQNIELIQAGGLKPRVFMYSDEDKFS